MKALLRLLRAHGGEEFVEVAPTVRCARAIANTRMLSAVLIDIGLPDGDGFELLRWFRARWPDLPAAIMTGQPLERRLTNAAFRLRAGFLAKPIERDEIITFLDAAGPARAAAAVIERAFERARREFGLTDREYEILRWVDRGNEVGAFAAEAGISENTVKEHVRRMLAKTGAANVKALAERIRATAWSDGRGAP